MSMALTLILIAALAISVIALCITIINSLKN